MDKEKKMRITKFDFRTPYLSDGSKTHLALVDAGANERDVLVLKASKRTTQTITESEYNDDGSSKYVEDRISVRDHGDDIYYVTEEKVVILDYTIEK